MCNFRQPLKTGTPIKMSSGAEYKINELIGCGGLSLVYSTIEANGLSTKIIKEFFPAPSEQVGVYAVRNKQGKVCPKNSSCQKFFEDARCRFDDEGIIGQRVAEEISQVIPFWEYYDGYAVMTRESRDMLSIELLTDRWEKIHPIPDGEENIDPVFDDIPRLKYSLSVIESLLVALSVIHKNYLHLDLSVTNILWACSEIETGIGGHIIITDFGSSACLDINGVVRPNYSLSSVLFPLSFSACSKDISSNLTVTVLSLFSNSYSNPALGFAAKSTFSLSINLSRKILINANLLDIV